MCQKFTGVSPLWRQAWVISGVLINIIGQGIVMGLTTSLLPAIMATDSPINVNLEQASWLAASLAIACSFGFVYSSFVMHKFGRRIAFIIDTIPQIVGILISYFAKDYTDLIIGRILCGITTGGTSLLGAIVIGEYSSPKYKEMFLNLKTAALYAGSAIAHLLGFYLHWRNIVIICIIPDLISLVITWTWPESPAWLASQQKFQRCTNDFIWLRGDDEEAKKELYELIKAEKAKKLDLGFENKAIEVMKRFTKRDFLRPLLIFFFAGILLETSGRHIFPAFATEIVNEVTGDDTYSMYYTLCLDIIILISATFSSALVKVIKIRTLLFTTGSASIVTILAMCLNLFLAANGTITNRPWISIILFALSVILVNLGCAPIPLTLFGTLFPLAHRGVGTTLAGLFVSIFMIISMKTIPILLVSIKIYGTFTLLAIITFIILTVLYFTLPETKDRTLLEIEYYFKEGNFKADDESDDYEGVNKQMIA